MGRPALSARQMEEAYWCARMAHLRKTPFSGEQLGLFTWYYHQMLGNPVVGLYTFNSRRRMLSFQCVPPQDMQIYRKLDELAREKSSALVGLSLPARCPATPDLGDSIQLNRYFLYCQKKNIRVLDMILIHRGGFIPLSEMKENHIYSNDPLSGWFN